jgi:hypothetical protein
MAEDGIPIFRRPYVSTSLFRTFSARRLGTKSYPCPDKSFAGPAMSSKSSAFLREPISSYPTLHITGDHIVKLPYPRRPRLTLPLGTGISGVRMQTSGDQADGWTGQSSPRESMWVYGQICTQENNLLCLWRCLILFQNLLRRRSSCLSRLAIRVSLL